MEHLFPCKECVCLAICKGQDMNTLLNKCSLLKEYMIQDLECFDIACEFMRDTPIHIK